MADSITLEQVGNWRKELGVPLAQALSVSMNVTGKTGEKACRQALIFMAQSAGRLATRARKNRRMFKDEHGQYVNIWSKGVMRKLYRWAFSKSVSNSLTGTWPEAREIGSRGLAKRSWMWGLAQLGKRSKSRPIAGTWKLATIRSTTLNGYMLTNKLGYISKVMPAGWEQEAQRLGTNRVMAQARSKLQRVWQKQMGLVGKGHKQTQRQLADFFIKAK